MFQWHRSDPGEPVAGFVDWGDVTGHSYSNAARRGAGSVCAVLLEMAAEIIFEVSANCFNPRLGRAADQVQVTKPELEHVAEQLLKVKASDPNGLAAAEKLREVPTAGTHD
jgi:hypothetical protein